MLIGIMSDSHDNFRGSKEALKVFIQKGVQLILHAGDMIGSGNCYIFEECGLPIKLVYGNNDGDRVACGANSRELVESISGTSERFRQMD